MDGKLPPGIAPESMMQQAQHIWSMLDEMASTDPSGYKTFIDKQIKEGAESMKPPEPHMCVQTTIQSKSGGQEILYINVFSWVRIPDAKDDESPIPVMGGTLYRDHDHKHGTDRLVSVAFNPEILKKYGIVSVLVEERRFLINLALDYIQDQHSVNVSRHYTLLSKDNVCTGSVKLAAKTLLKKTARHDDEFKEQLDELERTFGPAAQGCKDSLLSKISNITSDDANQSQSVDTSHVTANNQPEIRMPGEGQHKKNLVQEISGDEEIKTLLPEPIYDVTDKETNGTQKLVIKIQLPGVLSVQECQLDISQDDVELLVEDQYQLTLPLSCKVDNSTAAAKFNKKSSTLTLTLPILCGR